VHSFYTALGRFAVGEDYNILVMTRIREEAGDVPLRQAGHPGPGADRLDGDLGRWNWWPSAHGKRPDLASAAVRLTGPSTVFTPKS